MAAFAKAFINEGIAVGGDVPQDPKFWQNLKKEYLNNPEHSIDNWQHLTRKVPPQYMGEMKMNTRFHQHKQQTPEQLLDRSSNNCATETTPN